jgi:hypothetical protein
MKKSRRPVPRRFNSEAPRRVHNFLDSLAERIRSVEAEIGKAKAEGRDVSDWEAELEILRRNVAGRELPEHWPEWHLRTFVNEDFLREDPFKLRDALFINRYPNTSWWGIIEGLLYSIEREARRVLKENPPPFDVDALFEAIEQEAKISSTVSKTDLDYHIEKHFYAYFFEEELTHTQASAIAVLRGLNAIWQLTGGHCYPSGTDRLYDPGSKHTFDTITTSRIVLEMVLVITNAIRGEFLETLEPLIERGAAAIRGARSNREDNLNKVIIRELKEHEDGLKQSPLQIVARLEAKAKLDSESIVYEVTDRNTICWFDERNKARETTFHSFQNRVSKIKKRLRA